MRRAALILLLFALPAGAQLLDLREIAGALEMPVGIAHACDARLFIVTQPGQIFVFDGARLLPEPFLDIRRNVRCCHEQGLLGLAFHPRFPMNGFFYVSYVNLDGDLVIARYVAGRDSDVANPRSRAILMTIKHADATVHYSGQLAFGPDGYLYIGSGDGDSTGGSLGNAQNRGTLLGKILRIDVDRGFPYAVPTTNPFFGDPEARGEIWAYGLRNPWRFSFDRKTGDLWIADVGEDRWEEINLQPRGSGGGENYGWSEMEGPECRNCDRESYVLPLLQYPHDAGACSVTGGYRYRGAQHESLRGMYIYGDFCTGTIWGAAKGEDGSWTPQPLLESGLMISSFGEDAEGELYVVDLGGRVFRLDEELTPIPDRQPRPRRP